MDDNKKNTQRNLDLKIIKSNLRASQLGKQLIYLREVDSTNDFAKKLIIDEIKYDEKDGITIVTDYQTGGYGKSNRRWESEPNSNILMTVILKNAEYNLNPQHFTLLMGLIVCKTLNSLFDIKAKIKWPNDVIINNKKVSGILAESITDKSGNVHLIIGIGINVNQDLEKFSEGIKRIVTSLHLEIKKKKSVIKREIIIAEILNQLEYYYSNYEKNRDTIKKQLKDLSSTIGKRVRITTEKGSIEGLALDFEDDGGLMIREDSGIIKTIYSGDVEEIIWRE